MDLFVNAADRSGYAGERDDVTRYLEQLIFSTALLEVSGRRDVYLVLVERSGADEYWVDSGGMQVVRRSGLLHGFSGHPVFDWMVVDGTVPNPFDSDGAAQLRPADMVQMFLRVNDALLWVGGYQHAVAVETVETLAGPVETAVYELRMTDQDGRSWVNRLWRSVCGGYVVRSETKMRAEDEMARFTVLKLPVGALSAPCSPDIADRIESQKVRKGQPAVPAVVGKE